MCLLLTAIANGAGAALTFTLYDHVLTLDQEIDFIWNGTLGLSKLVFFYNRYGTEIILLFVSYSELSPYDRDAL